MTWRSLLEQWPLIEADLHEAHVDVGDPVIRRERSWRWGEAKILGLLDAPAIGYVAVAIPGDDKHQRLEPLYRYRVQQHFYGAKEG